MVQLTVETEFWETVSVALFSRPVLELRLQGFRCPRLTMTWKFIWNFVQLNDFNSPGFDKWKLFVFGEREETVFYSTALHLCRESLFSWTDQNCVLAELRPCRSHLETKVCGHRCVGHTQVTLSITQHSPVMKEIHTCVSMQNISFVFSYKF